MRRACAPPVVGDGVSARRGPKTCPRQWVALPSPVKAAGAGPLVAVPRERTLRNVPCGAVPDAPPNGLMYVITRRQPWASPTALGVKTVETRSWPAAGSSDRSNHRQTRRQTAGQATGRSHRTAAAGSPGRELAQVYPGWSGAATAILAGMGPGGIHRPTERARHTRRSDRNRMRRGSGTDANRRLVRLQSRSLAAAPRRGEAIARAVTGRRPPAILALDTDEGV